MIQLDKIQKIDILINSIDSLKEKIFQNSSITSSNPVTNFPSPTQAKIPLSVNNKKINQKKSSEDKNHIGRDTQAEKLSPQLDKKKNLENEGNQNEVTKEKKEIITIEMVKEQWSHIIEEIKKRKIALGSFLNEGWPESIEGNELSVAFGMENGFHISSINRNRKNIEEIIREVVGFSLRIKCIQSEKNNSGLNGNSYVEKLGPKNSID